jgi:RNA polymerase-binding transcription factor DksA
LYPIIAFTGGKAMSVEKKDKTSKAASKTTSKSNSKPASKSTGKPASKSAGKNTSKTASKAPGKTTSKTATTNVKNTVPQAPVPSVEIKIDWQAFTVKMEQDLLGQKSEIIDNLIINNNDFKEIIEGMDPKDFADIASDDIDRKMIEALGSQELKRLKLIDSALTRIKQGKYGYCIKCEKRIPPDRLEAIPYALMCVECKSEEERRNR